MKRFQREAEEHLHPWRALIANKIAVRAQLIVQIQTHWAKTHWWLIAAHRRQVLVLGVLCDVIEKNADGLVAGEPVHRQARNRQAVDDRRGLAQRG